MKKDKTKTAGYYLWYILVSIALFIVMLMTSKSIYDRWFSEDSIDDIQYNEMIKYQQSQGRNVYSDGEFVVIKTNKIITK